MLASDPHCLMPWNCLRKWKYLTPSSTDFWSFPQKKTVWFQILWSGRQTSTVLQVTASNMQRSYKATLLSPQTVTSYCSFANDILQKGSSKLLFIIIAKPASVFVMETSVFILDCVFWGIISTLSSVTQEQYWEFKRQTTQSILLTCSCHVHWECIIFFLNDETERPVKQQSICTGILHILSEMWKSACIRLINTGFGDNMTGSICPVRAQVSRRKWQLLCYISAFTQQGWSVLPVEVNLCRWREWWKATGGTSTFNHMYLLAALSSTLKIFFLLVAWAKTLVWIILGDARVL